MNITPAQIRAGRALANMNQGDLAEASGLARPTIVHIESGGQIPNKQTLDKILNAFENADIEFFANDGVRKRRQVVKIFRGQEKFRNFFSGVLNHARTKGGEICIGNANERLFEKWKKDFFKGIYYREMDECKDNHDFKILTKEGDFFTPASSYAQYRWTPKDEFANITFHVFGNILSIFLFLDEPIIFSIKNQKAADLYRKKFLEQWNNSLPIPDEPS